MGESLLRPTPLLVSSKSDGWGSVKSRSFDGLTKNTPCSKYMKCLAVLAGGGEQHVAKVCQHEGSCHWHHERKEWTEHHFTPEQRLQATPNWGKHMLHFPVLTHHVVPHPSSFFPTSPHRQASWENSKCRGLLVHAMKQEFEGGCGEEGGISR